MFLLAERTAGSKHLPCNSFKFLSDIVQMISLTNDFEWSFFELCWKRKKLQKKLSFAMNFDLLKVFYVHRYSTFVNWELWWPNFPILVYFKETQTKPEGQIHFFPVIFVSKTALKLGFLSYSVHKSVWILNCVSWIMFIYWFCSIFLQIYTYI